MFVLLIVFYTRKLTFQTLFFFYKITFLNLQDENTDFKDNFVIKKPILNARLNIFGFPK